MSGNSISLSVLEALGHGVAIVDEQGVIQHWNQRLAKLGIASEVAVGKSLLSLLNELGLLKGDSDEMARNLSNSCLDIDPKIFRPVALKFPMAPKSLFQLCLCQNNEQERVLLFEKVSDERFAHQDFEQILDSMPDGIFIIDDTRKIRLFNKACSYITGRSVEEILNQGCECSSVIQCHTETGESLATNLCPAKDVFRGDRPYQTEEMLLTNSDGEERWIETTYAAIKNVNGKVDLVVGMLRDVDDRKRLEEKLHQTEKLASLGQLVAGIAHEIKNPLAIINSSLDVLDNPTRPLDQKSEATFFIRDEVRHIDDLLRSFLAFARPRELESRPTVLGGIIQRRTAALEVLFPEIDFRLELPKPEPIIMADEEQLGQVLTNLVLNAGEAMDGRGELSIRGFYRDHTAYLEVEDSGPGIPPDYLGRIFDPFFTTKHTGTGLGLSICYQIVLAHRGTISVCQGSHGKGTLFRIKLPLTTRMEKVAENVSAPGPQHHDAGRQ